MWNLPPLEVWHNPHPHRVTHIQGLNGNPICTVNDEWSVTSPLCPHPMIKSQLPTNLLGVTCNMPLGDPYGNKAPFLGNISEAWREELRELASKVCTTDKQLDRKQVEEPRRSTQYSAETGRLIPPSSRAMTRQASRKANRNNVNKSKNTAIVFQDQELLILELLCQILQTDSLTAIQQWLLSAGQKEKDLVMGMIQTATANMQPDSQTFGRSVDGQIHSQTGLELLSRDDYQQMKNMHRSKNNRNEEPILEEEKPERIGTAEVLQIHSLNNENQSKPSE
ncbi:hypothetical protein GDO86_013136 [Hymenochirus boettgeri]|uniref:Protein TBATA n=1 Tax=Hymenochirus boettgeri TaxID=247094 RepID=A0A8T2ITL5_9PIPI|nr:hypothetical protein GDO86_013136 [Hymenochirus boettgeri]